jgi:hypothetical protein
MLSDICRKLRTSGFHPNLQLSLRHLAVDAIRCRPQHPSGWFSLARHLLGDHVVPADALNSSSLAISVAERALRLPQQSGADDVDSTLLKADTLCELCRVQSELNLVDNVVLKKRMKLALLLVGKACSGRSHLSAFANACRSSIRLTTAAMLLHRDVHKAISILENMVSSDTNAVWHLRAHRVLAAAYAVNKQWEKVRLSFNFLDDAKHFFQAMHIASLLSNSFPNAIWARSLLSWYEFNSRFSNSDDVQPSVEVARSCVAAEPNCHLYHLRLGIIYYQTGAEYRTDKRFAQRELLKVPSYRSSFKDCLLHLGFLL